MMNLRFRLRETRIGLCLTRVVNSGRRVAYGEREGMRSSKPKFVEPGLW